MRKLLVFLPFLMAACSGGGAGLGGNSASSGKSGKSGKSVATKADDPEVSDTPGPKAPTAALARAFLPVAAEAGDAAGLSTAAAPKVTVNAPTTPVSAPSAGAFYAAERLELTGAEIAIDVGANGDPDCAYGVSGTGIVASAGDHPLGAGGTLAGGSSLKLSAAPSCDEPESALLWLCGRTFAPCTPGKPAGGAPPGAGALALLDGRPDVRGVSFFYLDGVQQDLPFVLRNLGDAKVATRMKNLFASYAAAGINWVRLILVADHFGGTQYPKPTPELIKNVNALMGLGAGLTFELVLITHRNTATGDYADTPPYDTDKGWYSAWLDGLDRSHVGVILISGDTNMANPNEVAWHKEMWPWFHGKYPDVKAGYEVMMNNDPATVTQAVQAVRAVSPDVPFIAGALYFDLPAGTQWPAYADKTRQMLAAYDAAAGGIPLWVDEYGKSMSATVSAEDQNQYVLGFLGAAECGRPAPPLFHWVAAKDDPYNGQIWFGLAQDFKDDKPVWRPAFASMSFYYRLSDCASGAAVAPAPPGDTPATAAATPTTAPATCATPVITGAGRANGNNLYFTGDFVAGGTVDLYPGDYQPFAILRSVPYTIAPDGHTVTIVVPDDLLPRFAGAGLAAAVDSPCGTHATYGQALK